MDHMTITDRKIIFVLSTIIVVLVSTPLNTYPILNIQVSFVHGQEFTSEANNKSSISTITNNSAMDTQSMLQSFTISCTDFMKLFDTISALDIGDQVSENKVNQTTLDDIEQIFNSYAGNCSQLDDYEFE
ncbi:MAG TPA: hypothetical protein VJS91_12240 [Nitrososphaeraceae archaeon]|nr:hypothetical protein [Nitrososphaeraceae archaeon]